MRYASENEKNWVRWLMFAAGIAAIAFLAATLETGRAHALASGFSFRGALARFITPNNDHKNDIAILCFENPKASFVDGRVFDLRGNVVSGMAHFDNPTTGLALTCKTKYGSDVDAEALTWDGKSHGRAVAGGVYVYQIRSEELTVTGTFVVVR
ncbi:MAG: hypothetical protein WC728_17005 [Elusimicrobiota bacterium]